MSAWKGALGRAAAMAVAAYVAASLLELALISLFRPSELELTWISDAVLAGFVGVSTYLWLHLRATRAALSAVERHRLVLHTQLTVAADLQRALLPPLPEDNGAIRWGATLKPAGQIGGDFYDIVQTADGRVCFILADIAGKGIPAAMLLAYTRAVFRTLVGERLEPASLMARLSGAIYDDTAGQSYVTCVVGRLDPASTMLTYASAGHPPALIVRGAATLRLDEGGLPAGLLPRAGYVDHQIALQPGDTAVFFTDGISEALEQHADTAEAAIAAAVRRLPAGSGPGDTSRTLVELALASPGPAGVDDWQDDRTVLAFTVGQATGASPA